MFTFFATIFIVYFVWLVVKPLLAKYMRRKFQQRINDMFRQAYGMGERPQYDGTYNGRNQGPSQHNKGAGRKIFSKEDGEYVEFEDIQVTAESTYTKTTGNTNRSYTPREPQVSDAEWEDIR